MTETRPMPDGLHARIGEAEHAMSLEIGAAMAQFSEAVTVAMHKRHDTVAAALAESDESLRKITALFHGNGAAMPNVADGPTVQVEGGT